jgi:precorrin-4 methylase
VAVISWGTYEDQQTVTGTLADIANKVRRQKVKAPALIVVGEVVRLREKLQWFEQPVESVQFANYNAPNPFFELLAG